MRIVTTHNEHSKKDSPHRPNPQHPSAFTRNNFFSDQSTIFRKASCSCGGGCPACQAKSNLNISQPNDPAEIEADAIADKVMRMPVGDVTAANVTSPHGSKGAKNTSGPAISRSESGAIHRKCSACEEEDEKANEPVMRKEAFASVASAAPPGLPNEGSPGSSGNALIDSVISSGGSPLDRSTRSFFEPRFGYDLSSVRIHTDSAAGQSARSINAKAYTFGSNIVFGSGEYQPQSEPGMQLIAHELAHVAQQDRSIAGRSASRMLHRKVLNNVVEDLQPGAKACLVHIHGEEHTALAVAKELRSRRCVNLIHLDTLKRHIDFEFNADGFDFSGQADPNRIFSPAGRSGREAILETLPKPGQTGADKVDKKKIRTAAEAELQTYADSILIPSIDNCRANSKEGGNPLPVLALHNNEGLSPSKFKSSASAARSPNPATGDTKNPNDFFFTTQDSDFDALKGTRNVVLQENPTQAKNDDGSLSVLLADQRYINVEKEGRNHDKIKTAGGFQSHDKVYLQDYEMAAEALDLFGVPDMPCSSSPDFRRRTESIFNRRLGQAVRLPTRIATDLPPLDHDELPDPAPAGCLIFKDHPALDKRADEWRTLIDRMPLVDVINWVLGGSFTPTGPIAEFKKQQTCLIKAMRDSLKAKGLSAPAGDIVLSEQRTFDKQKAIWSKKFAFTGSKPFDRISDFARNKCSPSLGTDVQWNPGNKDHQTCWGKLTDEEKQKEILMASSAPGTSRHHAGVDFDFGQTEKDLEPKEWTGTGRFSDSHRWLARNASAFGFIQPFDTKGGYGTGYMSERWHWSYYPVAQAVLEFIMDHEDEIEAKLQELWGDGKGGIKQEFSFIATHWKDYIFNVEQEAIM